MTVLSKSISSYRSVIAAVVVVVIVAAVIAAVVVVVAAYERYRDKKSCQEGVENLWRDSAAKSSNSNFLLAREKNEGKKNGWKKQTRGWNNFWVQREFAEP